MKVKSITIIIDPEEIENHASVIKFKNGMWLANGPVFQSINDWYLNIFDE